MGSQWWAEEPQVLSRRQSLPHTEPQLPTTGDVWRIVKHMVQDPVVSQVSLSKIFLLWQCHRLMSCL